MVNQKHHRNKLKERKAKQTAQLSNCTCQRIREAVNKTGKKISAIKKSSQHSQEPFESKSQSHIFKIRQQAFISLMTLLPIFRHVAHTQMTLHHKSVIQLN